jgi:hypothetical protein
MWWVFGEGFFGGDPERYVRAPILEARVYQECKSGGPGTIVR